MADRARRDRRRAGQSGRSIGARARRGSKRRRPTDRRPTTSQMPATIDADDRRQPTAEPRRTTSDHAARPQLPGADGRRADEPRRAGVRPLLPAAQGAHHLPRHADRRHDRQPGVRPAAASRVGEPRQGHQPLHQLARAATSRRCSPSTTRCSTSSPTSPRSASARRRRRRRCCSPRAPRASASRCRTPGSCSTSRRAAARGQATDIEIQAKEILRMRDLLERDPRRAHGSADGEDQQGHRPRLRDVRRRGQGVRHHRRGDLRSGARRQPRPHHGRRSRDPGDRATWPSSETGASC